MNLLPSHAANQPMRGGADVDSQSYNYRVAQNHGEDASINGEEGNAPRYDLVGVQIFYFIYFILFYFFFCAKHSIKF